MIRFTSKIHRKLSELGLRECGSASVEFAIVFPFFVGVFISAFDVAMMNIRAVLVERATDIAVREIRLSSGSVLDYDKVVDQICSNTIVIPDCKNSLKIELQPVQANNWRGLQNRPDCIIRKEKIQPDARFENGQENQMMLMRVCAVVDPFFPGIGVGRKIPKDESGGYQLIATTAFVNEPK